MDPNTTILRVKRKRGTDPADALLLACKRIRPEPTQNPSEPVPEPSEAEVENSVFKLVATVATQDAPVQAQVRQTLARPRVAHAQRPSLGSSQRIALDQRNTKWSIRRDERYRILSSYRKDFRSPAEQHEPQTDDSGGAGVPEKDQDKSWGPCEIQVVDLEHEDVEIPDKCSGKMPSDQDSILCNSAKMLRERLRISGEQQQQQEQDDDYVYDLYYQETATPGWIQDILYVRAYADEGELVPDLVDQENEVYDDEDDENEEDNWRNEYPDEESDLDEDQEERYGNYWQQEQPSRRPRSWESYQRALLQELQEPNPDKDNDDDYEGDLYDSD